MKRYQVILLSFALGIFATTYFGVYFFNKIRPIVSISQETSAPTERKTVQIFLSNKVRDPGTLYCDRTYPVERAVSRLSENRKSYLGEHTYLALVELLKGPTEYEKKDGYFSSINEGTKIQQIIIENGVARVDFDAKFNEGVARLARLAETSRGWAEASGVARAGSCRVRAIRSQITETLRQFPEIKDVVISVNRESGGILQP